MWEFALFVFKQAWACLFGAVILALVLLTRAFYPHHAALARYDFLFLAALTVQAVLLFARMETIREAKVIFLFHVVGTLMELFKTGIGSWTYPESSLLRIGHVPLFSGFMYASVGSYLARTSRIMDMRYTHFPRRFAIVLLALAIYLNFFSNHYYPDVRLVLFAATSVLFGRTWVYYLPFRTWRRMPLLLGFSLVTLFIWLAENISTFAGIWIYPEQHSGWRLVHLQKYGSWFLLMTISFILVTFAHRPQPPPNAEEAR